ncbi:unnamed protein product [Caenorhabditis auriculariae]|uniref:Uncharacterized protein n=1 Tax=Caenorhabditis auriculariae TaxID=2777116 RepID=A0A8S1H5K8_9PELO|nr:unnamed protein product [Caenorhabditis auriculariae]
MMSRGLLACSALVLISFVAAQESDSQAREMEKRKSAYMRFGRSDGGLSYEKRKSAYMRFGKRSAFEEDPFEEPQEVAGDVSKRKSAYMRFGKRSTEPVDDQDLAAVKRKSAYMRFGKRSGDESSLGAFEGDDHEMYKRKSAYMRSSLFRLFWYLHSEKRSMLETPEDDHEMLKRKSAYMRFGK